MRDLYWPGRSTVHARNGMAATSHPLSTSTAINVLQLGGNAMDAAVAAVAVQCVVEPQSTAIGGDCFCLYAPKGGDVIGFNGSGTAPAAATAEWYRDQGIDRITQLSPHAVTIPGAIDAWATLINDHGTMSLGDLLQPAIGYARDGAPVNHRCQWDWELCIDLIKGDPTTASQYLIDGKVPALGQVVKLPLLAKTLEDIAEDGPDVFYKGHVAEDIVTYLQGRGGLHTMDDFANYTGKYVAPISTNYRGYDVYECPPNGQGIVALEGLNILSGFDLAAMEPHSAERFHLEIEATRLAYRDRDAVLADPDHADVPVEKWLSEEYAAEQRSLIDPDKRLADLPPSGLPPHKDTVYLTVVDKDRNAVSFINTIFASFGSGLTSPKTGVLLQNRGMGFVLDPDHPNCIGPNKRPLHTIIPGMLMKDGKAQMPFGVMGGAYQACGHMHLLTNLLDYGMDLQEALDSTRCFPDPSEAMVQVETSLPEETLKGLQARGHQTYVPNRPIGGAQAIWIDWEEGVLKGASEPRKDGQAIGY
jgi:gamma-glutamyltranspeptidase/glutathione hydrolase